MYSGPGSPESEITIPDTPLKRSSSVEEASFISRSGERYWIIRHMNRHTYLRLEERDYFLWELVDGSHTPSDLILAYLNEFKALPFERSVHLIQSLTVQGFLESRDETVPYQNADIDRLEEKKHWYDAFWELAIPLPQLEPFFSSLYQATGWLFRIRYLSLLFLLFCAAGVGYFLITEPLPSYPILLSGNSDFLTIISIYAIILCSAFLHECGHALVCLAYGRKFRDAGVLLYYGSPCLYIDTTDIWMAPRMARIIVSLAGPAVNIFIGSLFSLIVLVSPENTYSTFFWRIAFFCYCIAFINLNPLLEFDGYYALSDLLEIPDLRSRAFLYMRSFFRIDHHSRCCTRDKKCLIYLVYGIASALFTSAIVIIGIYFWQAHVSNLITELSKEIWEPDKILATLAIIAFFVPFLAGGIISGSIWLMKKVRPLIKGGTDMDMRG